MIGTIHGTTKPRSRVAWSSDPRCGGTFRPARDVTPAEEEEANRNAPAAIVVCDRCGSRFTTQGTNRHRPTTPPDLSVFDVAPPKG